MSSLSTRVGMDTSVNGGLCFQTFRDLLQQRKQLDQELAKVVKRMEKRAKETVVEPPKKYVPRMQNYTTLAAAIRDCMVPGKKMCMPEILDALEKTGSYKTRSSYFYTMVNNKLNRDPNVEKVSRGVFVLKKTARKRRTG